MDTNPTEEIEWETTYSESTGLERVATKCARAVAVIKRERRNPDNSGLGNVPVGCSLILRGTRILPGKTTQ